MHSRSLMDTLHTLWTGLRCRCPACRLGRLFDGGFHVREKCPYCAARFERSSGESLGAMYINGGLTMLVALGGFFAVDAVFHPPGIPHLIFWTAFAFVLPVLSNRAVRGLWVSITYLTGGVYPDPDYEREYIAPRTQPVRGVSTTRPEDFT